jgi:hypothetical protein
MMWMAIVATAVVMFFVGFYCGVSYGAPAWLDLAASEAKKRKANP